MRSIKVLLLSVFLTCIVFSDAESERSEIEPRGKKKKIALFVYFADIVLKKVFVLMLIYAFVFWVVIHKAGYFLAWFVSYLKDKKKEHHDHHLPHHYYAHQPQSYELSSHGSPSYGPPSYGSPSYGSPSYGPYRRETHSS